MTRKLVTEPASPSLYDNHGRLINYMRLAVTDRCNLRCFYCMPEQGIDYVPRNDLMTYEELLRLVQLGVSMGIRKLRITGGEPFVRKDMMEFIKSLSRFSNLEVHLTTNGTLTEPLVPELAKSGIKSVNLSLDTLDATRFYEITRRNSFHQVMATLDTLMQFDIPVKINAVVMEGKNIEDIIPLILLGKDRPISVRFIEEMPFNGEGNHYPRLQWTYQNILKFISNHFPDFQKIPDGPFSTSYNYQIPGFKGTFGVIAAFSRTFCGTCNRIRVTPTGTLKTCLYDDGVFNIRDLMRSGASDDQIRDTFTQAMQHRAKDGFEAEKLRTFGLPVRESMSTIGG